MNAMFFSLFAAPGALADASFQPGTVARQAPVRGGQLRPRAAGFVCFREVAAVSQRVHDCSHSGNFSGTALLLSSHHCECNLFALQYAPR